MTLDDAFRIALIGGSAPLIRMGAEWAKKQPWAEIDDKYVSPIYWLRLVVPGNKQTTAVQTELRHSVTKQNQPDA